MAEPIGNDATGYDVLTAAMKSLLNQFPGLYPDEVIKFEELGSEDGIAFSNDSGALVYTEKEDILGRIYQECRYPCFVVYRSPTGAIYPDLTAGRKIERVTRGNAYGTQPQENGVQDWVLPVTVFYKNVIEPEF